MKRDKRKINRVWSSLLLNNVPHSTAFPLAHTCILFIFQNLCSKHSMSVGCGRGWSVTRVIVKDKCNEIFSRTLL